MDWRGAYGIEIRVSTEHFSLRAEQALQGIPPAHCIMISFNSRQLIVQKANLDLPPLTVFAACHQLHGQNEAQRTSVEAHQARETYFPRLALRGGWAADCAESTLPSLAGAAPSGARAEPSAGSTSGISKQV